ncbi:MAG: hypothetical protein LKJ03_05835 [Enterococcaceae bacterium]|jgi:hypothetical protein|nr:hypothetical protein [Enterococcaceae bacterium]MCI1919411.1 hypothetical protein [Enterococcaceae bacterium]
MGQKTAFARDTFFCFSDDSLENLAAIKEKLLFKKTAALREDSCGTFVRRFE